MWTLHGRICKYCGHLVCNDCEHPDCRGLERGRNKGGKEEKEEAVVGEKAEGIEIVREGREAREDDEEPYENEPYNNEYDDHEPYEEAKGDHDISEKGNGTAECIQLCHHSEGNHQPERVLYCEHERYWLCNETKGDENENGEDDDEEWVTCSGEGGSVVGNGESFMCLLPRYVQKVKCCGCGLGMEKKPIKCDGCGHEECVDCHCLEKVEE
jgi:hypothetical protein